MRSHKDLGSSYHRNSTSSAPQDLVSSRTQCLGEKPAAPRATLRPGIAVPSVPGPLHALPDILQPVDPGEDTRPRWPSSFPTVPWLGSLLMASPARSEDDS